MKTFTVLRALAFSLFFFPLNTLVLSLLGLGYFFLTKKAKLIAWTLQSWARLNLWFLGVDLKTEGLEKIPQGGCLFLFNHSSFVDIFVLAAAVPNIKFGAKIELFSIPFFGRAMAAGGALPIPRKDRTRAIEILKAAEDRARRGEKFALAPEGGRGPGGFDLAPFKSGPFLFAMAAQVPLVPAVLVGADQLWPKGSFLPGLRKHRPRIELRILTPVPTVGSSDDNKQRLMETVREQMLAELQSAAALGR